VRRTLGFCAVAFLADTRGIGSIIPQKSFFAYNRFYPYHFHCDFISKPIIFKEVPMRKMFGFLIGVTIGGLVGSTIALLLAPDSGDELRAQLRERGQNFVSEVRQAAETRRIELNDRLETMRAPQG
jgi:hypothetical protein